jgi:hypothetical protein
MHALSLSGMPGDLSHESERERSPRRTPASAGENDETVPPSGLPALPDLGTFPSLQGTGTTAHGGRPAAPPSENGPERGPALHLQDPRGFLPEPPAATTAEVERRLLAVGEAQSQQISMLMEALGRTVLSTQAAAPAAPIPVLPTNFRRHTGTALVARLVFAIL